LDQIAANRIILKKDSFAANHLLVSLGLPGNGGSFKQLLLKLLLFNQFTVLFDFVIID